MALIITDKQLAECGVDADGLLSRFREQLFKDFEMGGVVLHKEEIADLEYDNLRAVLQKALSTASSHTRQQLLYRIDINERQMADSISKQIEKNELTAMSDLIIKRVLQKVIFKLIYSPKK